MSATVLTVNRQSRGLNALVVSEANLSPITFPTLVIGASRNFVLRVVTGRDGLDAISGDPQVTPTLSIGQPCDFPEGGTWTFTRGANTTDPLAFDISAEDLQTAIEGLASVGSGNVAVEALPGQYYKIEYIGALADTDIDDASVDGSELTPSSTASLNRYVEGGSGENEVQVIKLRQVPAVIQADWTGDGEQWTAPISTGSWEALVALAAQSPFVATLEIGFKLEDGSVEKLVQVPATIVCDVSAPDDFVPGQAPTFLTASQVNAKFATANTVWVSKSGNDGTGARGRFDRPFLTVTAAQAAAESGDTIIVLPGDYTGETALAGKDGVTYEGIDGAILPGFNVVTAITVKGSGLCQSLLCANAGAVMDMPRMDTVAAIECSSGTQTARNAGTSIECFGGTQTAGNAGTFIECSGGTQTAGNAGTFIDCLGGTQTAGGGRNVSVFFSGNCTITGLINDTRENGNAVSIANNYSGTLRISGDIKATNAGTDGATTGIQYGTGVTGKVQLKDVTIITAEDGSGTAKSIDAPAAQTVYIQGSLNATHDVDSDVTLDPDNININTNFE